MQNLKEVVTFILEIVIGVRKSTADDKWTWTDAVNFMPAAKALLPAVKDFNQIDEEWQNRTPEQTTEIVQYVKEKFDLDNKDVEAWVEDVVDVAFRLANVIDKGIQLF